MKGRTFHLITPNGSIKTNTQAATAVKNEKYKPQKTIKSEPEYNQNKIVCHNETKRSD